MIIITSPHVECSLEASHTARRGPQVGLMITSLAGRARRTDAARRSSDMRKVRKTHYRTGEACGPSYPVPNLRFMLASAITTVRSSGGRAYMEGAGCNGTSSAAGALPPHSSVGRGRMGRLMSQHYDNH